MGGSENDDGEWKVRRLVVNLGKQTLIEGAIGFLYWVAGKGGNQAAQNFIPRPSILSFAIA
jgi:hypothetical protein